MSRRSRNIFANLSSILLTISVFLVFSFYIFYQRESLTPFNPVSINAEATKEMSHSERIDEKQVEQELNKIAEEKRKKEEAERKRIEEQKRKKAEEARKKAEEVRKKKEAEEKAKKEAERIRLEKEVAIKKAKEEQERKDKEIAEQKEKEQQAAIEKAKKEEEQARKAAEAKAEKERQAQIAAANEAKITAALNSTYISQVHSYIHQNWQPTMGSENLATTIVFKVDQTGRVQGKPTIKVSSGNTEFDESVILAIMRASPLPMPNEPLARQRLARDGFEVEFIPKNFLYY